MADLRTMPLFEAGQAAVATGAALAGNARARIE